VEVAAATVASPKTAPVTAQDATKSILDDLAGLNIDLDSLGDLTALDSLLEKAEDQQLFRSFDLQEQMLKSQDKREQAGGRLVDRYGGGKELGARGIKSVEDAMEFVKELL